MNLTPLASFAVTFAVLLAGYPVALTLAGGGPDFRPHGHSDRRIQSADLGFAAGRLFSIITNQTLIAIFASIRLYGVLLKKPVSP